MAPTRLRSLVRTAQLRPLPEQVSDLNDLSVRLGSALDDLEPMQHVIGQAGKKAALTTFRKSLGADMRMSGFRRKNVKLSAGYDVGQPVLLNLRPKGLVMLADHGRKRSDRIVPRKRGKKSAVLTPRGPRAYSSYGPSRGLKVIDHTVKRATEDIPKALSAEVSGFIATRL